VSNYNEERRERKKRKKEKKRLRKHIKVSIITPLVSSKRSQ
jgi:hypothetical protein